MKTRQHRWFLGAGLVSAIVASLCCVGPLLMLTLGLGTFAAASWFAEWRPVFLAVTFALLGAGWFFALRGRRPACAEGACRNPSNRFGSSLILLSFATLGAVAFAAYPWFAGRVTTAVAGSTTESKVIAAPNTKTLRVRIPSMDCEACATGIAVMLRRKPEVLEAEISYATKNAVVRYDADATNTDQIVAAIDATGFKAERPSNKSHE